MQLRLGNITAYHEPQVLDFRLSDSGLFPMNYMHTGAGLSSIWLVASMAKPVSTKYSGNYDTRLRETSDRTLISADLSGLNF